MRTPGPSENLTRLAIGSDPADNTKTNGVSLVESSKQPAKSNVGGFTNCSPMRAMTNACTARIILSGRKHLSTSRR